MRRSILILASMWVLSVQAAVYQWVDVNGVTHYASEPHSGAGLVSLETAPVSDAPAAAPNLQAVSLPSQVPAAAVELSLQQPLDQASFQNTGEIEVQFSGAEAVYALGGRIKILMDGKEVARATQGDAIMLHNVDRGEHRLEGVAESAEGQVLAKSAVVTVYVHRASRLLSPRVPLLK